MQEIFDDTDETTPAIICPRCQTENDEDARFCAYCGAQFDL
jgi:rRNA maturation endonuclease Nob1